MALPPARRGPAPRLAMTPTELLLLLQIELACAPFWY